MARFSAEARGHLEVVQDWVDVSTALPRPDPRWTYTDQQGHEHAYGTMTDPYPTLVVRFGEPYQDDELAGEVRDEWLECPQCAEKIRPGTYVDTSVQQIPGRISYLLDGEPIGPEQAEMVLAAQRSAQEEAAAASRPRRQAPFEAALRAEGLPDDQVQRILDRMETDR